MGIKTEVLVDMTRHFPKRKVDIKRIQSVFLDITYCYLLLLQSLAKYKQYDNHVSIKHTHRHTYIIKHSRAIVVISQPSCSLTGSLFSSAVVCTGSYSSASIMLSLRISFTFYVLYIQWPTHELIK